MALSFSEVVKTTLGHKRLVVTKATFDSSYPTGGEALAAADIGLQEINAIFAELGDTGYVIRHDKTNGKLMAYYGDNNNASDGPLIEVPNATNLSTLDVHLLVIGI